MVRLSLFTSDQTCYLICRKIIALPKRIDRVKRSIELPTRIPEHRQQLQLLKKTSRLEDEIMMTAMTALMMAAVTALMTAMTAHIRTMATTTTDFIFSYQMKISITKGQRPQ
jgi:hypothetical protein